MAYLEKNCREKTKIILNFFEFCAILSPAKPI